MRSIMTTVMVLAMAGLSACSTLGSQNTGYKTKVNNVTIGEREIIATVGLIAIGTGVYIATRSDKKPKTKTPDYITPCRVEKGCP